MRYKFEDIFQKKSDGSLSPLQVVRVGGIIFGPCVSFNSGVAFGGVDFYQFQGHDIEAEKDGDVLVITGIY